MAEIIILALCSKVSFSKDIIDAYLFVAIFDCEVAEVEDDEGQEPRVHAVGRARLCLRHHPQGLLQLQLGDLGLLRAFCARRLRHLPLLVQLAPRTQGPAPRCASGNGIMCT